MLVLVTDDGASAGARRWLDDVVRDAALGGVNAVQLRDEAALDTSNCSSWALPCATPSPDRARFFINGDVDAAIALAADGLHLPEDATATADVRARLGTPMLHLARRAQRRSSGACRTRRRGHRAGRHAVRHAHRSPARSRSVSTGLRAICDAVRIPVIAIGGITPQNAADAVAARALPASLSSAPSSTRSPADAARALRTAMAAAATVR